MVDQSKIEPVDLGANLVHDLAVGRFLHRIAPCRPILPHSAAPGE
jgi:hypothetical protein